MSECLMDVTSASINTTSITWDSPINNINFHEMFEKFIITSSEQLLCDPVYRHEDQYISYRTTTSTPLFQHEQHEAVKKKFIGATFPIGFDYDLLKSNILHSPEHADFGYVRFADSEDYLLISKINHNI